MSCELWSVSLEEQEFGSSTFCWRRWKWKRVGRRASSSHDAF